EPNIAQALDLMNGDGVQRKVASPKGRLAKLLAEKKSDDEVLEELYLAALSRRPRPEELARVRAAFDQPLLKKEAAYALPDLAFALAALPAGRGAPLGPAVDRFARNIERPPTRKERFEDVLWA